MVFGFLCVNLTLTRMILCGFVSLGHRCQASIIFNQKAGQIDCSIANGTPQIDLCNLRIEFYNYCVKLEMRGIPGELGRWIGISTSIFPDG